MNICDRVKLKWRDIFRKRERGGYKITPEREVPFPLCFQRISGTQKTNLLCMYCNILSRLKRLVFNIHTHTLAVFLLLFSIWRPPRRGLSLRRRLQGRLCARKGSRSPPEKTLAAFAKRPPLLFPSTNVLQPSSTPLKRQGGPKNWARGRRGPYVATILLHKKMATHN